VKVLAALLVSDATSRTARTASKRDRNHISERDARINRKRLKKLIRCGVSYHILIMVEARSLKEWHWVVERMNDPGRSSSSVTRVI
jgi:hypothetical protein